MESNAVHRSDTSQLVRCHICVRRFGWRLARTSLGSPFRDLSRTHRWPTDLDHTRNIAGARLYFVAQNDFSLYLREPWRILAVWEGGLAFFGGLAGATLAGFFYTRWYKLPFSRVADLVAPAIPIGGAIGRTSCGLAGMDYGTPTHKPWGILYTHPDSYAPVDGISRHPTQLYELAGDLVIAAILLRLRGKLHDGGLFRTYLILFSVLRFFLFFVRGDVPVVALGLKNGQWTALVILALVVIPVMAGGLRRIALRDEAKSLQR